MGKEKKRIKINLSACQATAWNFERPPPSVATPEKEEELPHIAPVSDTKATSPGVNLTEFAYQICPSCAKAFIAIFPVLEPCIVNDAGLVIPDALNGSKVKVLVAKFILKV